MADVVDASLSVPQIVDTKLPVLRAHVERLEERLGGTPKAPELHVAPFVQVPAAAYTHVDLSHRQPRSWVTF